MKNTNSKIFFAPGSRGNEFLTCLAQFGVDVFNTKVVDSVELAKMIYFMAGKIPPNNVINENGSLAIYARMLKNNEVEYFQTSSFLDAQNLKRSIDTIRSFGVNNSCESFNDEQPIFDVLQKQAEFQDKNDALADVFNKYQKILSEQKLIDKIQFIRSAITLGQDNSKNKSDQDDTKLYIFDEFPITPLDEILISTFVAQDNIIQTSVSQLLEETKTQSDENTEISFVKAYGSINEIENIFANISKNTINLDESTIVLANTKSYSQMLYDFCFQQNIPVTFGCGISCANSNAASVLCAINQWSTTGLFGIDALDNLINNQAFDTYKLLEKLQIEENPHLLDYVIEMFGSLRLSFDRQDNQRKMQNYEQSNFVFPEYHDKTINVKDIFQKVQILENEICTSPQDIIRKYSKIPSQTDEQWKDEFKISFEASAINNICNSIDVYQQIYETKDFSEILDKILTTSICAQLPRPGYIHVDSINGAFSALRKNLFLAGFSSNNFPGAPKENYLVLDNDYLAIKTSFDIDWVPTSDSIITRKINLLDDLHMFATKANYNLHYSWTYFNSVTLKEQNPSSIVFEEYKKYIGKDNIEFKKFDKDIKSVGYFEVPNGKLYGMSRDYLDGSVYLVDDEATDNCDNENQADDSKKVNMDFNTSAASAFLTCKLQFFLQNILQIRGIEEDDPKNVISPATIGTILHKSMEQIRDTNNPTKADFVKYGMTLFEDFLKFRPSFFASSEDDARQDFEELLQLAYDQNQKFADKIIAHEKYVRQTSKNGITFRGRIDRIEENNNNKTIVDFKTGFKLKHVQDDTSTCVQGILYAFLLMASGETNVDNVEFRYPRKFNQKYPVKRYSIVDCKYNADFVKTFLEDMKSCCDNFDFTRSVAPEKVASNEFCRYCKYVDICNYEPYVAEEEKEEMQDE